ncbi:MAG: winged helix-turn-helix transcriptional regulator [Phycisphaeraceae bacterium]|nr:winged helix-turn-helix transcriptional regulator [Phycisphaeraceae bacterium]
MARPYRRRWDELDVFRALAHPVRRKIVAAALDQAWSFSQLQLLVHRSDATLAGHLRILREAKVLAATRGGRAVSYQVDRRTLGSCAQWLNNITSSPSSKRQTPQAAATA